MKGPLFLISTLLMAASGMLITRDFKEVTVFYIAVQTAAYMVLKKDIKFNLSLQAFAWTLFCAYYLART